MTYPVTPAPPVITPTTGECVNNVWTVDPADIHLTYTNNARWLHPTAGDVTPEAFLVDVPAGEYTFQATTAEGYWFIPESESYRLENGVANFTVTVAGLEPEDCTPVATPEPTPEPTVTPVPEVTTEPTAEAVVPAPSTPPLTETVLVESTPERPELAATGIEDVSLGAVIVGFALIVAGVGTYARTMRARR